MTTITPGSKISLGLLGSILTATVVLTVYIVRLESEQRRTADRIERFERAQNAIVKHLKIPASELVATEPTKSSYFWPEAQAATVPSRREK